MASPIVLNCTYTAGSTSFKDNAKIKVYYTANGTTVTITKLETYRTDGYTTYANATASIDWYVDNNRKDTGISTFYIPSDKTTATAAGLAFNKDSTIRVIYKEQNTTNQVTFPISKSATETSLPLKITTHITGNTNINGATFEGTLTDLPKRYTVTYNLNGGSGDSGTQYHDDGVAFTTHSAPTRTGYSFTNWKGDNGGIYSANTSYTINQNITLTAQWSANSYTITYNANGGSEAPSDTTYTYADSGTVTLSSTVPTRSGYAFKGWSTSSSATTATYSAGGTFPKNTASNTILYAVWWPYLDVNGSLDSTATGGVSGLGTFNITIGGSTLTSQTDYYQALQPGTSYSISNITQEYGYTYTGNTGSLSGTISNPTDIVLNYATKKPWDVNIRTNERTTSSIALSWGAEGLNITRYVLHYRADSAASFTHRDMGTSTTATLSLLEDTNYEIYVTATNSAGSTDSSHYNDSTLLTNPRIDNFVTTNITPFTVSTLTTVSQSRTRDLEYQFSTDGGTTWSAAQASNSYTFTGLNEETTYTLGVKVTRKHIGVSSSDTYATTTLQVTTPADQAQIWRHNGSVWQKGKTWVFHNNNWIKGKKIYRYTNGQWVVGKNN